MNNPNLDSIKLKTRLASILVDLLIFLGMFMTLFFITRKFGKITLLSTTFFLCKDCINGQSIGKRLFRLQVVSNSNGMVSSPLRSVIRNITSQLWPIEIIVILINTNRRLGDRIAGTRLVPFQSKNDTFKIKSTQLIISIVVGYLLSILLFLVPYNWGYKDQIGVRKEYYKSGKVKYKFISSHKDTLHIIHYFESSLPKDSFTLVKNKLEGTSKVWFENGKMEKVSVYKSGNKEGLCIWYFDNGNIRKKLYYKGNQANGHAIEYYENTKVKTEADMLNGKQHGLTVHYFDTGELESKVDFINGKKNGNLWFYYKNGKVKMQAKSHNNVTSFYRKYDETGKLIKEFDSERKTTNKN